MYLNKNIQANRYLYIFPDFGSSCPKFYPFNHLHIGHVAQHIKSSIPKNSVQCPASFQCFCMSLVDLDTLTLLLPTFLLNHYWIAEQKLLCSKFWARNSVKKENPSKRGPHPCLLNTNFRYWVNNFPK